MSIKSWLLDQWERIMFKYANSQMNKLKLDLEEVAEENFCFKRLYSVMVTLWLREHKQNTTIIKRDKFYDLISVNIGDKNLVLPVFHYWNILTNVYQIKEIKGHSNQDIDTMTKNLESYMFKEVLDSEV